VYNLVSYNLVKFSEDNKIYIKILYWGMAGSGKTTIVDTLYRLTKEQNKDVIPVGNLTKIERASGATLYFDRGVFQSKKQKQVFYNIWTVAGQSSFSSLRARIFLGTDGVIFVVDSQTKYFEDNIEALKELKNVARGKLIKEIPLIVMLNKQDLPDVIGEAEFLQVLKEEQLWFEHDNELNVYNPIIYETCALYNLRKNIYRSFTECGRQLINRIIPVTSDNA
jgi:small GTP-binding protein